MVCRPAIEEVQVHRYVCRAQCSVAHIGVVDSYSSVPWSFKDCSLSHCRELRTASEETFAALFD